MKTVCEVSDLNLFLTSLNHGNQFSDSFPKREVIIVHFDQKLFRTACCTNLNGIVKTQTNSND